MIRKAFTLIETLAVIAIITVLAAITFSVLSYARKDADKVVCFSNLKSLYQSLAIYQSDNGGFEGGGSLASMGYPPWMFDPKTDPNAKHLLIGTYDEWICPLADLHVQGWPSYHYTLGEAADANALSLGYQRYGPKLPIITDFNHNTHGLNIYAPRIKKQLIWVNIGGAIVTKTVTGSLAPPVDFSYFELGEQ